MTDKKKTDDPKKIAQQLAEQAEQKEAESRGKTAGKEDEQTFIFPLEKEKREKGESQREHGLDEPAGYDGHTNRVPQEPEKRKTRKGFFVALGLAALLGVGYCNGNDYYIKEMNALDKGINRKISEYSERISSFFSDDTDNNAEQLPTGTPSTSGYSYRPKKNVEESVGTNFESDAADESSEELYKKLGEMFGEVNPSLNKKDDSSEQKRNLPSQQEPTINPVTATLNPLQVSANTTKNPAEDTSKTEKHSKKGNTCVISIDHDANPKTPNICIEELLAKYNKLLGEKNHIYNTVFDSNSIDNVTPLFFYVQAAVEQQDAQAVKGFIAYSLRHRTFSKSVSHPSWEEACMYALEDFVRVLHPLGVTAKEYGQVISFGNSERSIKGCGALLAESLNMPHAVPQGKRINFSLLKLNQYQQPTGGE